MRDYGKVHTSFWTSSNIRAMSDDGRALALYLLTSPHGTIAGVFRLPDGYACEDLQWDSERIKKGFIELLSNGFANRCETTKWVWIAKYLEWNPPENPNQRKAAGKVASQVPDKCIWKSIFMRDCAEFIGLITPPNTNPSETLQKPFLNQDQEQEQELNPCAPDGDAGSAKPISPNSRFAEFWSAYPKKVGKKKSQEIWKSKKLDSLADSILSGLSEYKTVCKPGFILDPERFLKNERWADEHHAVPINGHNPFEGAI